MEDKEWYKKWWVWAIAAFVLIRIAGGGLNPTRNTDDRVPASDIAPSAVAPSPSLAPIGTGPGVEAALASCELDLFTRDINTNTLVGSVRVTNTGGVDVTARVGFSWLYGDGSKNTARPQTVTVRAGEEELVFFEDDISGWKLATAFQSDPDYARSKNCEYSLHLR